MSESSSSGPDHSSDPAPDQTVDQASIQAPSQEPSAEPEKLILRKAPRITPFLVFGGALGVLVALISMAIRGTPDPSVSDAGATQQYSWGSAFGFLAVLYALIGLSLGALVWLIVDQSSKKKQQEIYAREVTDPAVADPNAEYFSLSDHERSEIRRHAAEAQRPTAKQMRQAHKAAKKQAKQNKKSRS